MARTARNTTPKKKVVKKAPVKKAKKKVEPVEDEQQICHGAYAGEDDENCADCPDLETCIEETEVMEEELDQEEEEDDDEVEDDEDEDEFDPEEIDLSDDDTRIDTLSDLSLEELMAIVDHYDVDIPDDDEVEESEIVLAIDDHFARVDDDDEPKTKKDDGSKKGKLPAKRAKAAKKKAKPEPEDEDDDVEEEPAEEPTPKPKKKKAPVRKPSAKQQAADVASEAVELILTHNTDLLAAHGDEDHLTSIRDHINGILGALGKPGDDEPEAKPKKKAPAKKVVEPEDDDEDEEEEEEKPKKKVTKGKKVTEPAKKVSSVAPDYFAELAEDNELELVEKPKRITMKGDGRSNVATLLLKKAGWLLVLNGGDVDDYPGTVPLASWNDQPSMDAEAKKAPTLLKKHIKAMV